MIPAAALNSPGMTLRAVVLPQPKAPGRATIPPAPTSRDRFRIMGVAPYDKLTPSSRKVAPRDVFTGEAPCGPSPFRAGSGIPHPAPGENAWTDRRSGESPGPAVAPPPLPAARAKDSPDDAGKA